MNDTLRDIKGFVERKNTKMQFSYVFTVQIHHEDMNHIEIMET